MKCWMTHLQARCRCGCKYRTFELPADEQGEKWVARTRSGFAAFVVFDAPVFAEVAELLGMPLPALTAAASADTGDQAGQRTGKPAARGRRKQAEARPAVPASAASPYQELARWVGLLADPAPDGQPYDVAVGPVCPRCEGDPESIKVDRQLPEVVISLPAVTFNRWDEAGAAERRRWVADRRAAVG